MADPPLQQQTPPPPEEARLTKAPTGLGAEPLNIVVLGASFSGLACAHHFLDHTIKRLRITTAAPNYRLVIVSPSTHFYFNVAAPRALVSPDLVKHEDLFIPVEPAFHRHRGHNLSLIQGEAMALDRSARTVTIELIGSTAQKRASQINKRASRQIHPVSLQSFGPKIQTISYHAIILATGSSAHSDLLSLHGPHLNTMGELNTFHAKIAVAKSIVVCGGGCSGVETAGQLATYLNYSYHWPVKRRSRNAKRIVLITGSDRCLPSQTTKISVKAEKMLVKLGVEIKHGVRVIAAKEDFDLTGQTRIELNDHTSLIADVYIPCTGVEPNSGYLPAEMKDAEGFIRTNGSTLRLDHPLAGAAMYAIGDVTSYSKNCIGDVYAAVPVLMHNLLNDLLAREYQLASPEERSQEAIDALGDDMNLQRRVDSQLISISRFGGVGMALGVALPKFVVHLLKGHDYRVAKARRVVVDGGNPYAVRGKYL